jgi:hypothetical protein
MCRTENVVLLARINPYRVRHLHVPYRVVQLHMPYILLILYYSCMLNVDYSSACGSDWRSSAVYRPIS